MTDEWSEDEAVCERFEAIVSDGGISPADEEAEIGRFLAIARTRWPAALARIRELEAQLAELQNPKTPAKSRPLLVLR